MTLDAPEPLLFLRVCIGESCDDAVTHQRCETHLCYCNIARISRRFARMLRIDDRPRKAMKPEGVADQVAALPIRISSSGLEVLLVTSRPSRRWILPKGWPMAGLQPHEAAEREAFEEAGIIGRASASAVGQFHSQKTGKARQSFAVRVTVFPLQVDAECARWPEMAERERRWFTASDAAQSVQNEDLKRIILDFEKSMQAVQEREVAP